MQKLIIAVGSTRRPKLDGVRDAIAEFGPRLDPQAEFEIVGVEAPSGVPDTPLSRAEMMQGARNRAERLRRIAIERSEPWNYFVGVEGGLEILADGHARLVFLENWAYVLDRRRPRLLRPIRRSRRSGTASRPSGGRGHRFSASSRRLRRHARNSRCTRRLGRTNARPSNPPRRVSDKR